MAPLDVNPGFWRGRRVLVTGHTGFKGAWLSLWLDELGAQIFGLALAPSTTPSLFERANMAERVAHRIADIRDFAAVAAAMDAADPDIVLHLAAQALVSTSYEDPVATYATNVLGTAHVLEAARRSHDRSGRPRGVLIITSDKCYENTGSRQPHREEDRLGGHDPYSSSKACAELVTHSYLKSFAEDGKKFGLATARAGNVIGGGDWAPLRLVPDAIRAFSRRETLLLRNPESVRPWQHVFEPLYGYLLLAERLAEQGPAFSGAWNFGPNPDSNRTVAQIATNVAGLWGDGAKWNSGKPAFHESPYLTLDHTKAETQLGWRPRLSVERALELTVAWHRHDLANTSVPMRDFSLSQLREFAR